jgi:Uncharacterized protein conserved in bacteria (DUF2330)
MASRISVCFSVLGSLILAYAASTPGRGCCPVHRSGQPVVNADQTVILIWDPATKIQHFIRQASFKSEADDFGFLIPSPSRPELEESGNGAFDYLRKLTEPERKKERRPSSGLGCGCGVGADVGRKDKMSAASVRVLEEKLVAGFNAVVLETDSASALVNWLKTNGYVFSPEVEAWAKPYVQAGWKITALKVAKDADRKQEKTVAASALRMSFKTDRPLFPYREPDYGESAYNLRASHRLLRIYFIADARYQGELTPDEPWTGRVAWAGKIKSGDRAKALELLQLAQNSVPADWWLTEFEDRWAYKAAPADVYFSRDMDQSEVRRPPIIEYVSLPVPTDVMTYALGAVMILPPLLRRLRRNPAHS